MAVSSHAVGQRSSYTAPHKSHAEVNVTSMSVFHNLIFVALAAGLLWSVIGMAIS